MKGALTTTNPHTKTRFTYVPKYSVVKVHGKYSAILQNGKKAGVLILTKDGKETFKSNADYPHITGIPYEDPTTRLYY